MNTNELTRRLLAEGFTPEDTPPGTNPYNEFNGGWTYDSETRHQMVFETPCGLLVKGSSFGNGWMSYHGIDWIPENNNPTVCCPKFTREPCPLLHPVLRNICTCRPNDIVRSCACHQTDRPYTFEESVDKAHEDVWREAEELWEQFKAVHKGRVCRLHSRYGRTVRQWSIRYNPIDCTVGGCRCEYCDILAMELDKRKGNVFYDVRKTWTEKGVGFLPDQQRVAIEKGIKLLDRTVSLTICEAVVKYARTELEWRARRRYHRELYFDDTMQIEIENIRAERRETRDIFQDLRDVEAGIEVIHVADTMKAAKEQKKARREAALAGKVRKIERMILDCGWEALDTGQKRRAEKLLDGDRIEELNRQHHEKKSNEFLESSEEPQISLF